ncbi:hypothetical protein GOP47_0013417 [Adiantum capillus-veneris]|uniref:L-lactate dehydrogenase n=1 Tax=Adiantum capillus-veneris TaxID=13818 RepID=A0A9D4UNN8_ADICA|nr:hypothetical protein GOP47_0013417 [Adiantum capillus-veneris]
MQERGSGLIRLPSYRRVLISKQVRSPCSTQESFESKGATALTTKRLQRCPTFADRQREGETRLSLLDRNLPLFKSIIPELVRQSPDTILLTVSNPVDILTYLSWKLSGLPPNRVIGTGTNLDSSRLHFLIADKIDVNARNIHGYMVGEHGDNSVPLWLSLTVANVPVLNLNDKNGVKYTKETLKEFHEAVVGSVGLLARRLGFLYRLCFVCSMNDALIDIEEDEVKVNPFSQQEPSIEEHNGPFFVYNGPL